MLFITIAYIIACGIWFEYCAAGTGKGRGTLARIFFGIMGGVVFALLQGLLPRTMITSLLPRGYNDQDIVFGILIISAVIVFILGLLLRMLLKQSVKSPQERQRPQKRQRHPERQHHLELKLRKEKPEQIQALAQVQQKRYEIILVLVILALGIDLSCLYFGQLAVPNPDFTAFVHTGEALFSFKLPGSFKRAPVLGLLQVGLGYFMPGPHPNLTAGWLLNALLYPLTGFLLYLIAKRFIGKAAVWFSILTLVNPLSLTLLRQPLAETTLKFFAVLTIYLILKRSRGRYLAASIATMVRYDGAGLILAAFVMDLIESQNLRSRLKALSASALASAPLALWLLGMYLNHRTTRPDDPFTEAPYINHYDDILQRNVLGKFTHLTWQETVGSLLGTISQKSFQPVETPSKVILVICLTAAVGYGLYKKQWKILALLTFSVPYFFVHALRFGTTNRHALAIGWVVLLLGCYGLHNLWKLINHNRRLPRILVVILQIILLIGAGGWLASMVPNISNFARAYSPRSLSVPYIAISAVALVLISSAFIFRGKGLLPQLAVSALMGLMIVTNQYKLIPYLGTGAQDMEFKTLALWYRENAQPGEKLVVTMPYIVKLYAPEHGDNFVETRHIAGETYNDFVQDCIRRKITYVTWDSRIGSSPGNAYYIRWKVGRIAALGQPPYPEPFELIHTINNDYYPNRFIRIFRFHPELVDKR